MTTDEKEVELMAKFAEALTSWGNGDYNKDVCDIGRTETDRTWEASVLMEYRDKPSIIICFMTMKLNIWRRYFINRLRQHHESTRVAIEKTVMAYRRVHDLNGDIHDVKLEIGWDGDDKKSKLPNTQHIKGKHGVIGVDRYLKPHLATLDTVKIGKLMALVSGSCPVTVGEVENAVDETCRSLANTRIPYCRGKYYYSKNPLRYTARWLALRILVVGKVVVHCVNNKDGCPVSHSESLLVCGVQTGFRKCETHPDHVEACTPTTKKSTAATLMGVLQKNYRDPNEFLSDYNVSREFNMLVYGIVLCMDFKRKKTGA